MALTCDEIAALTVGDRAPVQVPERLNPLLKVDALRAADEAACRLDGMFRDLFNEQERLDLIVTIIRAATTSALGLTKSV